MLKRFIAGKFRDPSGWAGRVVGSLMARGNRRAVDWTVSLLGIEPDDRILEVGFGPGVAIELAARAASAGKVAGIDSSPTMVDVARRRNAAAVEAGRVDLRLGDVAMLPYQNHAFDKVFSIHCIYFWANPIPALRELRRVLRPGGIAAVTILPRDRWLQRKTIPPPDLFALYTADEIAALLDQAGFHDVCVHDGLQQDEWQCTCITGIRKATSATATPHRQLVARQVGTD